MRMIDAGFAESSRQSPMQWPNSSSSILSATTVPFSRLTAFENDMCRRGSLPPREPAYERSPIFAIHYPTRPSRRPSPARWTAGTRSSSRPSSALVGCARLRFDSVAKVHPTGLEPVTFGSADHDSDRVTTKHVKGLRETPNGEVPTVVPSPPGAISSPDLPPDLARLVAVWNRLPDAIKAGVLALVQAAGVADA
jgi:hypothetical protein